MPPRDARRRACNDPRGYRGRAFTRSTAMASSGAFNSEAAASFRPIASRGAGPHSCGRPFRARARPARPAVPRTTFTAQPSGPNLVVVVDGGGWRIGCFHSGRHGRRLRVTEQPSAQRDLLIKVAARTADNTLATVQALAAQTSAIPLGKTMPQCRSRHAWLNLSDAHTALTHENWAASAARPDPVGIAPHGAPIANVLQLAGPMVARAASASWHCRWPSIEHRHECAGTTARCPASRGAASNRAGT